MRVCLPLLFASSATAATAVAAAAPPVTSKFNTDPCKHIQMLFYSSFESTFLVPDSLRRLNQLLSVVHASGFIQLTYTEIGH
eukprot:COSAG05_NODE_1394_length_4994_cov_33.750358_3_plen_82_part_00